MSDPAPPLFFLGFNRTATRALCRVVAAAGVPTLHWGGRDRSTNAAYRMHENLATGRPVLHGLDGFRAFADLTYCEADGFLEGVRLFRRFRQEHPDAMFVLNTREVDDWLASRLRCSGGDFAARAAQARGVELPDLLPLWRAEFHEHHADVEDSFTAEPGRFLRFHIDRTPIERLRDFLAPGIMIDPAKWERIGAFAP